MPQSKPQLFQWHVTGFEPFGEHERNPSSQTARAIAQKLESAGERCALQTLPVTFAVARDWPAPLHDAPQHSPLPIAIHVGLAASRAQLCFEAVAHNHHGPSPDNDGLLPLDHEAPGVLDEEGPAQRVTSLDLEAMVAAFEQLREHEPALPHAVVHEDTGSYVCNAIYYASLAAPALQGRALFLHMPMLDEDQATRLGTLIAEALLQTLCRAR